MSVKKYLQQFTKEQLIEQILELQKKYKDVKTHYEFALNPGSSLVTDNVKKAIHKKINSSRGPKLGDARKEITSFKKLSPSPESLADIMLHYVECGVAFTREYGDIDMPFYNSVAGMFHDTCEFINKNGLKDLFDLRCKTIVDASRNIGWGFHDDLSESFYSNF